MENKINIAELLKDCPSGMELDSPMYDNLYFDCVEIWQEKTYAIKCYIERGVRTSVRFTKYGQYNKDTKCVIFPKGKTTWEGFMPPCRFKEGDVIYTDNFVAIFSNITERGSVWYHCYYCIDTEMFKAKRDFGIGNINCDEFRFATEEEKEKLFQAIKDNGYHWNAETKTLEKLVEPKFKVGDRIVKRNSISNLWIVSSINSQYYGLNLLKGGESIGVLSISEQDDWELAPNIEPKFKAGDKVKDKNNRVWFIVQVSEKHFNISRIPNPESAEGSGYFVPIDDQDEYELVPDKFDITTLKPFDKVLYRMHRNDTWLAGFYNVCIKNRIFVIGLGAIPCCIPYEGNQHLLGTTNDCDEFYKNW